MSGITTNFAWSYPTNIDAANVAGDMQTLATSIDGTLGNAWTAYTPAWTAATVNPVLGNGTIFGRFKTFGKWGIAQGILTMGGTTTFGTGTYSFSVPGAWTLSNALAFNTVRGSSLIFDFSTGIYLAGLTIYSTATTIALVSHNAVGNISPTVPLTFAVSDVISWEIIAELA